MFENLRTGNIIKKLNELMQYNKKLRDYDKNIKDFIPKNILINDINDYFISSHCITYNKYTLKLNNIDYIFDEKDNYYIKVNNIIIVKGEYWLRGVKIEWNHTLPKEMLSQIKEDSKTIDKYIKDIKDYMKTHETIGQIKYHEEQKELENIFCNK